MTPCPLTSKELECIKWLSEGHMVPHVAEIMGLKKQCIQKRIFVARGKAGAATIASLVAVSIRKGWIQ